MFDYHGWAIVRSDPYDQDDGRLHETIERFQCSIGDFNDGSGVTDVRQVNGAFHVWFAGHPNHRHECVFKLLPWLAEHAPGSFGLLYVWDDEDPEFNNAYQVWCFVGAGPSDTWTRSYRRASLGSKIRSTRIVRGSPWD